MLTELRVRDLAVIADARVELAAGLNVLTGETGAGKSLLVDALSLLLGERAESDLVRRGATRAVVEGAFEIAGSRRSSGRGFTGLADLLDRQGIELEDGRIVLKREVQAAGRSRAWVNGSPVSAGVLAEPGRTGAESVEFVCALNPGLGERPVAKAASGGELSRLMLALKVELARHDAVPTLVFDEVDAGIGGQVADKVAEALGQVAEAHQVLVITHLPQIAAAASRHCVVAKGSADGVAQADVQVLHGEDRVEEVARMMGGSITTARKHAAELLRR